MDRILEIKGFQKNAGTVSQWCETLFGELFECSVHGDTVMIHDSPRELTDEELAKLELKLVEFGREPEVKRGVSNNELVEVITKLMERMDALEKRVKV